MIRNSYLPAYNNVMTERARSRNPGLCGNHRVPSDLHVMPDMHEIIDLYAFTDSRVIERSPVNGCICPNLHVIGYLDDSCLRKFPVTLSIKSKSESIRPEYRSGMNSDPVSHAHSRIERHPRMNPAIFPNPASCPNDDMRTDLGSVADVSIFTDDRIRTQTDVRPDMRQWRNDCGWMNPERERTRSRSSMAALAKLALGFALRNTVFPETDTPSPRITEPAREADARPICFALST